MELNEIIQIDLGRYPLKLIFAFIVILLTVITSFGEKNHAEELNKLPRNRTEISNIKKITMTNADNLINVFLEIEYIYEITLSQHIQFLRLEIVSNGIKYLLNSSNLASEPILGRHTSFAYQTPIYGEIKANLYRSKTLLKSESFNIQKAFDKNSQNGKTSLICSGYTSKTRKCEFSNVCMNSNSLLFFSEAPIEFENPLFSFSKTQFLNGKKGKSVTLDDYLSQINQTEIADENTNEIQLFDKKTLVLAISNYLPYDWEWISSFSYIIEGYNYDSTVLIVQNLHQIGHLTDYIKLLSKNDDFNFQFHKYSGNSCFQHVLIDHFIKNSSKISTFREKIIQNLENTNSIHKLTKNDKDFVLNLLSNSSNYQISNLNEVSKAICKDCSVHTVFIEESEVTDLIKSLQSAKFVVAPHSIALSQTFWMKGTLFEFIPKGGECIEFPKEPISYSKIKHLRFITNETNVELMSELIQNKCNELNEIDNFNANKIKKLFNQTVSINIPQLTKILNN
ncbi:hypothetical protein TRFO_11578 [Tritrichomonas foetus]|uniref:Uncharacterized protein n=1 Tax=Tritrichomonas foetus TaxID=1144522 RepID=A0A1J4J511_9EUKA|nr:hypothetical protein TRFO_11578 [Tritrichomonas foetus]|eukprot:OHS93777.1 hypothetical protein TRFO_11578 [Tritrichomonas foetus]